MRSYTLIHIKGFAFWWQRHRNNIIQGLAWKVCFLIRFDCVEASLNATRVPIYLQLSWCSASPQLCYVLAAGCLVMTKGHTAWGLRVLGDGRRHAPPGLCTPSAHLAHHLATWAGSSSITNHRIQSWRCWACVLHVQFVTVVTLWVHSVQVCSSEVLGFFDTRASSTVNTFCKQKPLPSPSQYTHTWSPYFHFILLQWKMWSIVPSSSAKARECIQCFQKIA